MRPVRFQTDCPNCDSTLQFRAENHKAVEIKANPELRTQIKTGVMMVKPGKRMIEQFLKYQAQRKAQADAMSAEALVVSKANAEAENVETKRIEL